MRITSWNLLHGLSVPPANGPAVEAAAELASRLAGSVKALEADVLAVQEVDYFLERSGNLNQVAQAAAAMGAKDWAFAPSVIGSPDEDWKALGRNQKSVVTDADLKADSAYGIGLISKLPVESWHRLNLRPSPVGVFMAFPVDGKFKKIYIRDHPRSAIACVLENGWLIVNTHLSFVPIFNIAQLLKIKRWIKRLPVKDKQKIILMGDLNLPWVSIVKGINWNSLAPQKTFPSWSPKWQLDYILSQRVASEDVAHTTLTHAQVDRISDHLPLSIEVDVD